MRSPWLLGIVRDAQVKAHGFGSIRRVVPNLTVLYRPKVKFQGETRLDPDHLKLKAIVIDMRFAF